jgi:hypothetical protein
VVGIAPRITQLAQDALELDTRLTCYAAMLDQALGMYVDIYEWAANTEHSEAAAEVLAILDRHRLPEGVASKKSEVV